MSSGMREPFIRRRRSIRLPGFDYRSSGAYYVTICTHRRDCIFDDKRIAQLLTRIWGRTTGGGRHPDKGEFVVMPNHVHAIVSIGRATVVGASRPRNREHHSMTNHGASSDGPFVSMDGSPLHVGFTASFRSPDSGSLGALVTSFGAQSAVVISDIRRAAGGPD